MSYRIRVHFVGHGQDDILTTTIRKSKHSGRVCGVGGAFGLRDYCTLVLHKEVTNHWVKGSWGRWINKWRKEPTNAR